MPYPRWLCEAAAVGSPYRHPSDRETALDTVTIQLTGKALGIKLAIEGDLVVTVDVMRVLIARLTEACDAARSLAGEYAAVGAQLTELDERARAVGYPKR